jgi:hypothetical protein
LKVNLVCAAVVVHDDADDEPQSILMFDYKTMTAKNSKA